MRPGLTSLRLRNPGNRLGAILPGFIKGERLCKRGQSAPADDLGADAFPSLDYSCISNPENGHPMHLAAKVRIREDTIYNLPGTALS